MNLDLQTSTYMYKVNISPYVSTQHEQCNAQQMLFAYADHVGLNLSAYSLVCAC